MGIDKFTAFAERAHYGQKRRNGEPYIEHPKRIAAKFSDETTKMVAIGHDLLEETALTPEDLLKHVPERVVRAIQVLTRKKSGQNYYDYITSVIASKDILAIQVKIGDLEDNMSDLDEGSMKDKYRFAHEKCCKAWDALRRAE